MIPLSGWLSRVFSTRIGIFTTIYLTPLVLGDTRGFSAYQIGTTILSKAVASTSASAACLRSG